MQRTIEFRGLTTDTNEMVFGDLIHGVGHKEGNMYILPNIENLAYVQTKSRPHHLDGYEVIPETVGQFTGLIDKNEVEVFKDDKIRDLITGAEYIVRFGFNNYGGYTGWYLEPHNFDGSFSTINADYGESKNKNILVIGNIHKAEGGE
jgi:hypothetical protein